jgi:hypothetical protein
MAWLHAVIDVPAQQHGAAARFWAGVLGWPLGPAWPGHPELRSFEPPDGAPYVHLQRIGGPARVHLDLEVDDPAAGVRRAVGLGAALVAEHDRWRALRSPGGLPFCLVQARDHEPPRPVTWPDGHRARMVQLCIDLPRSAHEVEMGFWRALLTGGRWAGSEAREFAGKWHDDAGSPLQLLFQRLDEPDGVVRAHLDHGTDARAAEVRRLLALGAADVGPGRGWHVLRDVAGQRFCVTDNSPEAGQYRDIG